MGKLTPKDPVYFNTSMELKEQLEIARFIRQSDLKFKESEFFKQLETCPVERKKKYTNVVLDFNLVCHHLKEAFWKMGKLANEGYIGLDYSPYPANRTIYFETPYLARYAKNEKFVSMVNQISEHIQKIVDILGVSFDIGLLTALLGEHSKGFVSTLKFRYDNNKLQYFMIYTKTTYYKSSKTNKWFDIPIRISMK